jgi:DNA replication protein DnaC
MLDGKMLKINIDILKRMCIPDVHLNAKMSSIPDVCKHKKIISKYILNLKTNLDKGRGLYLFGDYGNGKSAISCIILKYVGLAGKTGIFVKANDVAKYIIEKIEFEDKVSYEDRMLSVDVLVLDDLIVGVDKREIYIEHLVRKRIDNKKVTIITSNQIPTELSIKYPALAAVSLECIIPVKIDGHNFRRDIASDIKQEVTQWIV